MVSLFLLVATAVAVEQLIDGVPIAHHAEGADEVLFSLKLGEIPKDRDLTVSVSPYGGWDSLDVYMDVDINPTPNSSRWKAEGWLFKSIVLPNSRLIDNSEYNILVKTQYECFFSIVVSLNSPTNIDNAWSLSGLVNQRTNATYVMETTQKAELYLLEHYGIAVMTAKTPDKEFYSQLILGSMTLITINPPLSGQVQIDITASSPCSYSLITVFQDKPFVLQDGLQVPGKVMKGEWDIYMFYAIETTADIVIRMATFTGDPDIYVSQGKKPTFADYTYKAEGVSIVDNIVISKAARKQNTKGWYYIGVFGKQSAAVSTYHVSASLNVKSFSPILAGQTHYGKVSRRHTELYFLETPPKQDFSMRFLQTVYQGNPELFVKFCKLSPNDCVFTSDQISNPHKCKA